MVTTRLVRYFALGVRWADDDPVENAAGLMREVQERAGYRLERVDRGGRWVLDYDLLRYLTGKDDGYAPLTPEQAEAVAARLGAVL